MLPETDKVGQIQRLTGVSPRQLRRQPARDVAGGAGVGAASPQGADRRGRRVRRGGRSPLRPGRPRSSIAGGYFLTEDEGRALAVFPISERLRYLVPFAEPLGQPGVPGGAARGGKHHPGGRRREVRRLAGHPPARVHGGLARAGSSNAPERPWLAVSTFSRVLDSQPPRGRGRTCPPRRYTGDGRVVACPRRPQRRDRGSARPAGRDLPDGARLARLLRGRVLARNFLGQVSRGGRRLLADAPPVRAEWTAALAARPGDPSLLDARELALARWQANDAYWHGVFGGCYLPHLRRAVRSPR